MIYTDSQAAINRINRIIKIDNTRKILKMVNNNIFSTIKQLIIIKDLNFMTVKVKGHSGVVENDRADVLAKEAAGLIIEDTIETINLVNREAGYKINFSLI